MKSVIRLYTILFLTFLAAGMVSLYFINRPVAPERIAAETSKNLQKQLTKLDAAATAFIDQWKSNLEPEHRTREFNFFIVDHDRVLLWTDNAFVPSLASVRDSFNLKLLRVGSSDYLARKWVIGEDQYLVGILPLTRRYAITNDYLKTEWNNNLFPPGDITILDPTSSGGIQVCAGKDCPFRVDFIQDNLRIHIIPKITAVLFLVSSLVFLILLILEAVKSKLVPDLIFLVMLAILFMARLLMTGYGFPGNWIPGELFNPLIFASSSLNASLGDLLLNEAALFVLCYFLFRHLGNFRIIRFMQQRKSTSLILAIVSSFLMFMGMLFPFVVIQTLYNNSTILIGISESLRFDGLRIAALVAVALAGLSSFLFTHAVIRHIIQVDKKFNTALAIITGLLLFVWTNQLSGQHYMSSAVVGVFHFVIIYLLGLYSSLKRLSFTTFTYLFLNIFSVSVNGAYAIHHFGHHEKIENQFKFARTFLVERDYFGEYLLGEFSRKIGNDAFIQSRVATPFLSKDAVRQKIRQVFLPSYFNKYDVEIYTFNSSGESSENRTPVSLQDLLSMYNTEAYRTEYEGVYFINSPALDVTQKYLVVVPVTRLKAIVGHVVVEFSLKKVIPENVYPELLVDNRFLEFYRGQEINYAVFNENELAYSSGFFNYEALFDRSWFGFPELHTQGLSANGYDHIAVEDENGRIAIVSSRQTSLTLSLSNFSFLLVIGLVSLLLFIFFQGMMSIIRGHKLYFSARIQLFLNLAFFLPLIIVSIMSLSVTNRSSERQINEEYLSKTKKFSEQVADALHDSYMISNLAGFENKLTDLTQLTNLDANVYNSSGILIGTSQPLIFDNNLLSSYVNPEAFRKIGEGNNLFIVTERVGSLEYSTAFSSLKAPSSGVLIGIIGIPFFQSMYSLEKIQINLVANILNIFAVIFVILVVLSYFVTQWLTFPLNFITQSLRKTSLTKINQPLVWKADDEIGMMVKEYNQMLYSLSESKAELERTQRERAWREIAQQVAHEIKNPLTPMKLTLQQLERQVDAGTANPEKTGKAVSSLLTQVNTLNDIASSFSSFAKMPEPVMKPFELASLLKRVVDLHSQSGEIRLEQEAPTVWVNGDEQLLGRTFSNIILNAFQAAIPDEPAMVIIRCELSGNTVLVSFKDNGKGIEAKVAERIFLPHFTTKQTGSGLGLAIARQAIEQMKGKLWFETSPGKGSTFFIELPASEGAPLV